MWRYRHSELYFILMEMPQKTKVHIENVVSLHLNMNVCICFNAFRKVNVVTARIWRNQQEAGLYLLPLAELQHAWWLGQDKAALLPDPLIVLIRRQLIFGFI